MIKRIFHYRLKSQLQNLIFINYLIQLNVIFQNIPVTHFLDLQIAADVLLLFLNGNKLLAFAENLTEKVRQGNNHCHCFVWLIGFDQPHNGVECVVKEMRLDLLLEEAQVCLSHFALIFLHLVDQGLHISRHLIKAHRKFRNLIVRIHLCPGIEISLGNFLRHGIQLPDGLKDSGNDHHRTDSHYCNQHRDQNAAHHHKASNLFLQGVCNLFHVPGLIVNVILDVILDQLCKNIDIVIQHLDILTVPASGIDAVHNIIHSFFQSIDVSQKTLQPQLTF